MRTCSMMAVLVALVVGCQSHHHDPATRPTASDAVAVKVWRDTDPFNMQQEQKVAAPSTAEQLRARQRTDRTAAALQQPLGEITFSGTALSNAFERLRTKSGVDIFVNWRAMEKAGAKQDLPVTCTLKGTVQDGLLQLLNEVGSERVGLGYVIDEGVVTVSTKDDLALNTVTRVYDVRSAITAKEPVERQKQVNEIVRVVQGIRPLAWREHGGNVGAVRELSGQLIVTATPEMQKRVREALAKYDSRKASALLSSRRD